MLPLIPLAMAAYGVYTGIKGASDKKKADKLAREAINNRPEQQISESSKAMLADAQGRLNSVSPGLLAAYQQLQQGTANQMGYAQRNASSGAQALAVGANAQADANAALPTLAGEQDNYNQQNRAAYYGALSNMDQQEQLVHQDRLGKYSDLTNFYLGQVGAGSANQSQGMQLAATGLLSAASGEYDNWGKSNARVVPPATTTGMSMDPYTQNGYQGYGPSYKYNPLYSTWLGRY